jgi:hypothetical protein
LVQLNRRGNVQSAMHMTDLSERERQRLGAIAGGLLVEALVGPDVLVMVGRELEAKLEAAEAIEAAEAVKTMAAPEAAAAEEARSAYGNAGSSGS